MPIPNEIELPSRRATTEELANKVGEIIEQYGYKLSGFLDTDCAREFGGWLIKKGMMVSKDGDVGMSTKDTDQDDIRFFAGDAIDGEPKFIVTKSGKLYAMDGTFVGTISASIINGSTITGGTVRTESSGARVEMSNNSLKTYSPSNMLQGFAWGADVSGNTYGDTFFYHSNTKLMEFYDNITSVIMRGVSPATGFILGGNGVTTYPQGPWNFSNNALITGIPISAITNLQSIITDLQNRISYLENNAFVSVRRSGDYAEFSSKNTSNVDDVSVID